MSYKSWAEEFYPVEAGSNEAKANPISHSLRKWIGLREENLSRHDLYLDYHAVKNQADYVCLNIDADSCALCAVYYKPEAKIGKCAECPLYQVRGAPCDTMYGEDFDDEAPDSPYHKLINSKNPEPMIKLLERALELSKE